MTTKTAPDRRAQSVDAVVYWLRMKGTRPTAHILDGNDTLCRLASTGGLYPENYRREDSLPDHARVCFTCAKRQQRQRSATPHTGQPEQREMAAFQALREAHEAERRAFDEYVNAVNQRSD